MVVMMMVVVMVEVMTMVMMMMVVGIIMKNLEVMLSEHRMLTVCKHSVSRVFTHPKLTVCGHLLSRVFKHPMLRVCEHLLLRVCQVCWCVRLGLVHIQTQLFKNNIFNRRIVNSNLCSNMIFYYEGT